MARGFISVIILAEQEGSSERTRALRTWSCDKQRYGQRDQYNANGDTEGSEEATGLIERASGLK